MEMLDTIVPRSDQINADDLIGQTRTITVTGVKIKPGEQPVTINFEGDRGKPYKPGKSMCRILVALWGPDANAYVGRSMTLYRDPAVKWGGLEVGGIRISHMSHIQRETVMALTETKGNKKPHTVKPLKVEAPAQDKATVAAEALIARISAATDDETLRFLTAETVVTKQRAWLAEKRPELAERVDAAVQDALARFVPEDDAPPRDVDSDGFPTDEALRQGGGQ